VRSESALGDVTPVIIERAERGSVSQSVRVSAPKFPEEQGRLCGLNVLFRNTKCMK